MVSNRDVEADVRDALSELVDGFLDASGFRRTPKSIDYVRTVPDGKQYLRFNLQLKPAYNPNAESRLNPHICAVFPALNQIVIEMVKDAELLVAAPEITFNQPIDIAMPKDQNIRWYTSGRASVYSCISSIQMALNTWTIPFLDEYKTIGSLTTAYVKHDPRFMWQRQFYIYIAAAFMFLNQPACAMKVLDDHFGKPGARKKYAKIFDYVESRT